ncbi:MAG TPA: hypothetical protein VME70_13375 [Mycobacteriales bacterium]|nr:hypothetical protein [Mycobacteriales bacterium]
MIRARAVLLVAGLLAASALSLVVAPATASAGPLSGPVHVKAYRAGVTTDVTAVDTRRHIVYSTSAEGWIVVIHEKGGTVRDSWNGHVHCYEDCAIRVDDASGDAYISATNQTAVTVIKGQRLVRRVPLPAGALGGAMIVDQRSNDIYVADSRRADIEVLHGTRIVHTIALAAVADALALDPSTGELYVASSSSDDVIVIKGHHIASTVTLPFAPAAITVDPTADRAYAVDGAGSTIAELTDEKVTRSIALDSLMGDATSWTAGSIAAAYGTQELYVGVIAMHTAAGGYSYAVPEILTVHDGAPDKVVTMHPPVAGERARMPGFIVDRATSYVYAAAQAYGGEVLRGHHLVQVLKVARTNGQIDQARHEIWVGNGRNAVDRIRLPK